MKIVTISPKFQVVIPKELRESLRLIAGQKIQVTLYDNRIELIPMLSLSSMRGFLRGIDTTIESE